MFFNKKIFDDNKKIYLYDIFFVSNQNISTEHNKIVKNSRFFLPKLSIPGFSMFLQVSRLSGNPAFCKLFPG